MRKPIRICKLLLLTALAAAVVTPASAGSISTTIGLVTIGQASGTIPNGTAKAILVRFEYVDFNDPTFQAYPDPTGDADYKIPPIVEYFGCIEIKVGSLRDGDCSKLRQVDHPAQVEAEPLLEGGSMSFSLPTTTSQTGRTMIATVLMDASSNPRQIAAYDFVPDKSPPQRPQRIVMTSQLGLTRDMKAIGAIRSDVIGGGSLSNGKGRIDQATNAFLDLERSRPLCYIRDIQRDGEPSNDLPDIGFSCVVEHIESRLP